MAIWGNSITVNYVAWDTANNVGKTGDVLNHTIKVIKDGTEATATNSPAEVDSVNAPGIYKLTLTATEMQCDIITVCGKSSTANIVIIPITISTEHHVLPNVQQGNAGCVPTTGTGSFQINLNGGRADANTVYWNGAAVSAPNVSGVPVVDIVDINGSATNGNNATLSLKQLNIVNSTGDAIVASSTGSNGNGVNASGNGTGSGLKATAGGTGHGMNLIGGGTSGNALNTSVTSGNTLTGSISGDVNGKLLGGGSSSLTGIACQADTRQFLGSAVVLDANNYPGVNVVDWAAHAVSVDASNYPNVNTKDYGGTLVTGGLPNSGNVTVGGYAASQDPGSYILTTPSNKLTTDSSGNVTPTTVQSTVLHSSTATAGAAGSITLAAGASSTNNLYNGNIIKLYGGTGAGQTRTITAYNGTTKVATVDYSWTTNPDATTTYAIHAADNPLLNNSLNVTVGTNNDKSNYSLTQAFPSNFSSMVISGSGYVTTGSYAAGQSPADYVLVTPANKLTTDVSGRIQIQYGTGTGQLSASSGVAAVNLTSCNGSAVAAGAIPNVAAGAAGGMLLFGTGTGALNTSAGNVTLTSVGLDNIVVETGVNARQALAIISSAVAGVLSGAATTTISIQAANNPATNRVTATCDANGNRSVVTLNLP